MQTVAEGYQKTRSATESPRRPLVVLAKGSRGVVPPPAPAISRTACRHGLCLPETVFLLAWLARLTENHILGICLGLWIAGNA